MSTSILIVEDHEKVRRALQRLLEVKFSQYQVINACSGEEAITLTLAEAAQLIIMDITLPGINEIEATRRIRAISSSPQVVMFTVHEDGFYRQEAQDACTIAYVAKLALQCELLPMGCTLTYLWLLI